MKPLRRSFWRFELIALVVALQGALLGGSNVVPSQGAVNEQPFATVAQPIGNAASPNQLLVTHPLCEVVVVGDTRTTIPREVVLVNSDGSTSTFATLPSRIDTELNSAGCGEDHIVIATPFPNTPFTTPSEGAPPFPSQNPAGFTSGDKFVTQGANVYRIRWNATIPHTVSTLPISGGDLFATLGTSCPLSSPTIDTVGTWNFKLIVVVSPCSETTTGKVVVLNSNGTTANTITLPTTLGTQVEGPVVAPCTLITTGEFAGSCDTTKPFGKFAGQLLITAENVGKVYAVSPSGTIQEVANVPSAEDAKIVPTTRCSYGLTNGFTYFTNIFNTGGTTPDTVDQLPLSAFSGEDNNALVPSANGTVGGPNGITRLTPTSTGVITSSFRTFFAPHQGSTFTDCGIPVLVKTQLNTPTGGFVRRLLAWMPGKSPTGDALLLSPPLAQAIKADNNNNDNNSNNKFFSVTWFPDPNFDPTLIRKNSVRLFINGKVLSAVSCRGVRGDDEGRERRTPQAVTCFFRFEDAGTPPPTPGSKYKIVAIYRAPGGEGDPECEGGGG